MKQHKLRIIFYALHIQKKIEEKKDQLINKIIREEEEEVTRLLTS